MTRYPQYADFKRMEDENTALHIAASNDKLEVLKYLCSLVRLHVLHAQVQHSIQMDGGICVRLCGTYSTAVYYM